MPEGENVATVSDFPWVLPEVETTKHDWKKGRPKTEVLAMGKRKAHGNH
jgi:hypothetical protein